MRGSGPMTITRITMLLRVVNTSPTLQSLSVALRSQETAFAMARRLNTTPDDQTVRLISSVWGAIVAHAWGALGTDAGEFELDADNIPERMHGLLVDAFAEFSEIAGRFPDHGLTPAHRRSPNGVHTRNSVYPTGAPMTATPADRPLKVIQWTTGNIGRRSLHAIIGRAGHGTGRRVRPRRGQGRRDAAELAGWPEPPA